MPSDFQPLHEGFEEFEIDNVIFDDQNVDGWYSAVKEARREFRRVGFKLTRGLMGWLRAWGGCPWGGVAVRCGTSVGNGGVGIGGGGGTPLRCGF